MEDVNPRDYCQNASRPSQSCGNESTFKDESKGKKLVLYFWKQPYEKWRDSERNLDF